MSINEEFVNPQCSPAFLDHYGHRCSIVRAIKSRLGSFNGTLLDIGCGVQPYRDMLLSPRGQVTRYVGLDLPDNGYGRPDLEWDGRHIPLGNDSADCAIATEVFEHCPEPEVVMREALRVLRPGGFLFFTVPFLWPLHCSPHDEYRYTPFALERHFRNSGFATVALEALGGWNASLAQMIALWVRRGPLRGWQRWLCSCLATFPVRLLLSRDQRPATLRDGCMVTGLTGVAHKAVG